MEERCPELDKRKPVWWHHHATKMRVVAFGLCKDVLVIQGSVAELVITRKGASWLVTWKVVQGPEQHTIGQALFSDIDLLVAFGLRLGIDNSRCSRWLIERYGGTAARQGKYIRYKNHLNIPCPGTGHDGDPNISIDVDEGMQEAVRQLVCHCR